MKSKTAYRRMQSRDFLGIRTTSDVPDEKTVWKYREALTRSGTYDKLFEEFSAYMAGKGLVFTEGKIIDARWTKKRDETHYGYKEHTVNGLPKQFDR